MIIAFVIHDQDELVVRVIPIAPGNALPGSVNASFVVLSCSPSIIPCSDIITVVEDLPLDHDTMIKRDVDSNPEPLTPNVRQQNMYNNVIASSIHVHRNGVCYFHVMRQGKRLTDCQFFLFQSYSTLMILVEIGA